MTNRTTIFVSPYFVLAVNDEEESISEMRCPVNNIYIYIYIYVYVCMYMYVRLYYLQVNDDEENVLFKWSRCEYTASSDTQDGNIYIYICEYICMYVCMSLYIYI